MQLDLKKIPFSRRHSRHMIYEESDNLGAGWDKGLYLAIATENGGGFIGGPLLGPKGFIKITPTFGGETLDYSYAASPSILGFKTDKGSVRFALDGSKVLRIEGQSIGLRLDVKLGFGGNALLTKRGIEITLGGTIYLIKTLKGKVTLDCKWNLKALKVTDPIIYIEPDESGIFEQAVYDTDDAYELPDIAKTLDICAAESEADYNRFISLLHVPGFVAGFADDIAYVVYSIWMGFVSFKGAELAYSNKLLDQNIYTTDQAMLTLPMKDAALALDILGGMLDFCTPQGMVPTWLAARQNLDEAVPPLYALSVSRLIENGSLSNIPKDKLSTFYDSMSKTISWWQTHRINANGLSFYAYRHECGWVSQAIFGCGTPSASPDLATYLALAAESLSKIAAMLNKADEATKWNEMSIRQLDLLTSTLWDGKRFNFINALTNVSCPAEGLISLIPLILGKRLPENIINAVAEKTKDIPWDKTAIIPASLILMGLKDSGKDTEAATLAMELINSCIPGGVNDQRGKGINAGAFYFPAACAALLALCSRIFQ